ncbi:MAG: HAD family hydrolase [Candidatus Rifleibacteriota bacterium]
MKNYRYVIWDWNGTLLNDVNECIDIINTSLSKRNIKPLDKSKYLEKFQFPVKKYYQEIGFDFSKESFEEAGQEYIDAYAKKMLECQLQTQSIELLKLLKNSGVDQYILSALNHDALEKCIDNYELAEFFTKVRGLDDYYAHSKVELGRALLREENIPADKAVLIGDTVHDYETAEAMGVDCILVADGHNSGERLKACSVPVFEDLRELKANFEQKY